MGEQIECPVCTLFLRPGITLEDHLETHPKDQVIKALVALATRSPSSCKNSQYAEQEIQPLALAKASTALNRSSCDNNFLVPNDPKIDYMSTSRQNLMIVNRQSTMVYHSSERDHQRMLTHMPPSQLQMFGLTHHNQTKPLPPPPAYGTAINHLRSQQNQSFFGHQNQNSEFQKQHHNHTALDFALPRNSSPRPSPSPSVLRFAESPVAAHYVERDNGDFIVQETPRHVVECVEKDDGEFSVIEKVIRSPPSVVQFHESDNEEFMHLDAGDRTLMESDDFCERESLDNNPKKSVPGITVLSNVKLDPADSFDVENITGNNSNQAELIWTGLTEPPEEDIKKENYELNCDINQKNSNVIRDKYIIEKEVPSCSATTTSVIRLASNKQSPSQKQKSPKANINRPQSLVKRPFKKPPKKLIVKFKVTLPQSDTNSSVNNESGSGSSDAQVKSKLDLAVDKDAISKKNVSIQSLQNEQNHHPHLTEAKKSDLNSLIINNETEAKLEQLEAAHPMIVHESSLSQEPVLASSGTNDNNRSRQLEINSESQTENKDNELSKLLDECLKNDVTPPTQAVISAGEAVTEVDGAISLSSSSTFVDIENSDSLKNDSSTFNSFPTTSSFSKPSTSSFALREQTDYQNPSTYADYPFGMLYGTTSTTEEPHWNRFVMLEQNQLPDYTEEDGEKSSYIDLDTFKITSSEINVPLVSSLNIRTDEKMPAKGEISEQESNGDIENSWSQPPYSGTGYRFANPYDNYFTRESWSLSNDELFHNQEGNSGAKMKFTPTGTTEIERKKPKKTVTREKRSRKTGLPIKKKQFQCAHCDCCYSMLKERNAHLMDVHNYHRINRRLVRNPLPATITTPNINEIIPPPPIESTENIISTTDSVDDIKPEVQTEIPIVNSIHSHLFPRTKYDSIRAGVYRMLMNFNLSVLQQKNIEVDKAYFESKSFCCFTCKRDFISVKLFDEHLADHPAECFTCGRKFTRWTYFSLHLKRHLGWKDFACTICNKKFVIRSAMVEHMRMHTGISPLKCSLCDKHFKRYSNLTQHKKACHSLRLIKKKDYVCYCGEVMTSKARFIWHKETHDTKPKCCPYCRDRFVHINSLRRHIRLTHSDKFSYIKPVKCKICDQVYAKASLKAHMTTHSMDTQHECSICNKSFSTKWNLKIHSWVHANRTAKPFKCEFCVKAFVREIDYKNHINSHKHIKPFTCEYCGCKFIRKYNYMRHRQEHLGQKKFSCDLCGKLFHRHYYLIEHRRTHTGERPFLCTICGKSSTTKTNHNKHLKIHHSRDPFTSEA